MHLQVEVMSLVLSWSCCRWKAGQVPLPSLASSSSGSNSGLELAGKLFSPLVAFCKLTLSIRLMGSDLFYSILRTNSSFDLNLDHLRSSWFMSIIRISCSEPRPLLGTWEGDGTWLERDWSGALWPLHLTDGGQPSTTTPKNITPFWPNKYQKIIKTDDVLHLLIAIVNCLKYLTTATVLLEKIKTNRCYLSMADL